MQPPRSPAAQTGLLIPAAHQKAAYWRAVSVKPDRICASKDPESPGLQSEFVNRDASDVVSGDSAPPLRLIVSGGGTGGHIYPALTTIRTLEAQLAATDRQLDVLWIGTAGSLEARVATAEDVRFEAVATGKIRRAANPLKLFSRSNILDMCRVPLGVLQARRLIAQFGPDVVLTTGGYVAVPTGLGSWLARRPLVVHEQTVRLGLANRLLSRLASRIALSSGSSLSLLGGKLRHSAVVTGNPVRAELFGGDAEEAVSVLGLGGFDRGVPTVYVTGGAQGAVQINRVVREVLPWMLERANVIHQCGKSSIDELTDHAATLAPDLSGRYLVTEFVGPELADVFDLADVVISRSGAGTIAEITALGKASVLIPLASAAGNEQAHNAGVLAERGAAVALLDEVSAHTLRQALEPLLRDTEKRTAIAQSARLCGHPDAAEQLAQLVLSEADRRRSARA
ncbi:UDP-N-acetylglucosamine--N-acetylmuramyl-(pentapeptide) pyrophosphoryl-undecaprenol N-acetylglucosamine transferase [Nocardia uniformis]|uniref:UDP-N-acetylglucosamine--N-acetylmuramyl- (pentapeptide) pyrophosphoryl-undecaprenol N-acetylglucosamine transferase n=1 Tax=Nocardia uniformis TaxID=53432 RepID=UPI001FDF6C99|nr:UDP-N-acetylglucosamine--N-acetylmuramyl-(pentapeptide) pyrophosphoryl-undecaprenol N-acetylglucosamine transferase [Nocardia uniformis]